MHQNNHTNTLKVMSIKRRGKGRSRFPQIIDCEGATRIMSSLLKSEINAPRKDRMRKALTEEKNLMPKDEK